MKPPTATRMNKNELIGIVPQFFWPYNAKESASFRKQWQGWANDGCSLFLRPNYTSAGHGLPYFFAHTVGPDIQFAYKNSLLGCDFDSLNGQWAGQGPTWYVMARMLQNPDQSTDGILDEYYSAFGPAKDSIKEYWIYWESVTSGYDYDQEQKMERENVKYGSAYYAYYVLAPHIYSPDSFTKAESILAKARSEAKDSPDALARIEWQAKGLKHAELILATQRAFVKGLDTGDRAEFRRAYKELKTYRRQIEDDNVSNLFALVWCEDANWKRLGPDVLKWK
jgi:hypothetical protein